MSPRKLGQFLLGLVALAVIFMAIHRFSPFGMDQGDDNNLVVHPVYSPVPAGAHFSTTGDDVPESSVTLANNGVAHLQNGVTITLKAVFPTSNGDPAWDTLNKDVKSPVVRRTTKYASPYGTQTIDRTFWFVFDALEDSEVSIMSYVASPDKPEVFHAVLDPPRFVAAGGVGGIAGGVAGGDKRWRMGEMDASCKISSGSERADSLFIPRSVHADKITIRVGVGTGEWKSVLDYPNPFYSEKSETRENNAFSSGNISVSTDPSSVGSYVPIISLNQVKHLIPVHGEASRLIPRRALPLDANGNLVGSPTLGASGSYVLSESELRRCKHIIVQERDMRWAEFRDIPIRPAIR